jgi:protein phosphatase
MATTLTVAHIHNGRLYLAHCGDSRAYYFNPQGLQQISRDHNQAEEEIESSRLKPEEIAQLPIEKYIQLFAPHRMLGDAPFIEVDSIRQVHGASNECHHASADSIPLSRGDYIILTTDGLLERFDKDERKAAQYLRDTIVLKQDAQAIATSLVSIARCKGTSDNTTVLVIQVRDCQPSDLSTDDC